MAVGNDQIARAAVWAAVRMLTRLHRNEGELSAVAEMGLQFLWGMVDRGEVLRRIRSAIDRDSDTISRRVNEANRTKAAQNANSMNPDPSARRVRLQDIVGEDVAQRIAKSGLTDRRGKTVRGTIQATRTS